MSNNAIEFINVSKKFKKGEKFDSLRDLIPSFIKNTLKPKKNDELSEKEFWAVKDVSFELKKGEVLGIIGHNGAGKSTILKLLSQIIKPTNGEIKINGKLSALIEVGAGFHEDLTGRENIYLNGTIMGMSKKEIDKNFDSIIDFSELEEFIDTPVKKYSSGMYVRLGFSVAIHMCPDILLVDEVLSVGDLSFQNKCSNKMKELLKNGISLILVSHNIELINNLADRTILFQKGKILAQGEPLDIAKIYKEKQNQLVQTFSTTKEVFLSKVELLNKNDEDCNIFHYGSDLKCRFYYESKKTLKNVEVSVVIRNSEGVICIEHASSYDKLNIDIIENTKSFFEISFKELQLVGGCYYISVAIADKKTLIQYDYQENIVQFKIDSVVRGRGVFLPKINWNLNA